MEPETFGYAKYGFWMAFIGIGLCQFCMLYICCRACCCSQITEPDTATVVDIPMNLVATSVGGSTKTDKSGEPPPSYSDLYTDWGTHYQFKISKQF